MVVVFRFKKRTSKRKQFKLLEYLGVKSHRRKKKLIRKKKIIRKKQR